MNMFNSIKKYNYRKSVLQFNYLNHELRAGENIKTQND